MNYFAKMRGTTKSPPRVSVSEIALSWAGSFLGIASVAYVNFHIVNESDLVMLIASFGASAVLVYGAIKSPLAQPRNLIGGHVISALIGVAVFKVFHGNPSLAAGASGRYCDRGHARDQDLAPSRRGHRPDSGYWKRPNPCARLYLCVDPRGSGCGNHALCGPRVQQHTQKPQVPGVLVVIWRRVSDTDSLSHVQLVQVAGWGSPLRTTQSRLITSLRRPPALRSCPFESESV